MVPNPRWLYTARSYDCNDPKAFVGPHECQFIANGAFSTVWRQPDGTILKVCKKHDGTYEYLLWAQALERAFGLESEEMQGVPRVHAIGLVTLPSLPNPGWASKDMPIDAPEEGWWAVLDPMEGCGYEGGMHRFPEAKDELEDTIRYVKVMFDDKYIDMHSGNVMFDRARGQYILTDPFCDADGMDGTAPPVRSRYEALEEPSWMNPRKNTFNKVSLRGGLVPSRTLPAQFKMGPLQNLRHMQIQRLGDPREAKGFT